MKKPSGVMGLMTELDTVNLDEPLPVASKPDNNHNTYDPDHIYEIETIRIKPWAFKDRQIGEITPDDLAELVMQIHLHGQQQPILLRPTLNDKHFDFEEIFGFKRVLACRELGIKVKARIRSLSDPQAFCIQVSENSGRSEPSAMSRALSFYRARDSGLFSNVTDIAHSAGLSRPSVSNLIRIADNIPYDLSKEPFVFRMGIRALLELVACIENDNNLVRYLSKHVDKLNQSDNPAKLINKLVSEKKSDKARSDDRKTVIPCAVQNIASYYRIVQKGDDITITLDAGKGMIDAEALQEILTKGIEALNNKRPK